MSDATRLKKHWESDNVEYSWKGFPPAEHAINIILRNRNAFRGTRHNVNDPRQDKITARKRRGSCRRVPYANETQTSSSLKEGTGRRGKATITYTF